MEYSPRGTSYTQPREAYFKPDPPSWKPRQQPEPMEVDSISYHRKIREKQDCLKKDYAFNVRNPDTEHTNAQNEKGMETKKK
ncbi:hypothetical protein AX774_g6912 [Zancudomyces culisetae]|uniref:Uncharacterized protein n=1 Tax=Zancudomyces culisetae TaxID=1213189 RepID=A0A1R1PFH5_ZANCU|nr:hypothetical protein AX774_g6912 [Zancudomyces culisetae]|eukprot:OMH79668.1 hypothetical protein AX774_g6912 [Zancudomyces culisetae]